MKVDTFFKLSEIFLDECKEIQMVKGAEYTIDDAFHQGRRLVRGNRR